MNWPKNWTAIAPTDSGASAMDKYQQWLQLHSDY
jgi:hypothetical protein